MKGTILYLPVPIESTIKHVVNTLPDDGSLSIIVKQSSRQKFKTAYVCSIPKVYLMFLTFIINFIDDRCIGMAKRTQ